MGRLRDLVKIKGKLYIQRQAGHGESNETIGVAFDIPQSYWVKGHEGWTLKAEIKSKVQLKNIEVEVELPDLE